MEKVRLFTAITFEHDTKDSIYDVINELRPLTIKGSFTIRDNLHITLNFIGETSGLELVKQAMELAVSNTDQHSFNIATNGFGRFKSRDGEICWLGIEKEEHLWRLQKELTDQLKVAGFVLDNREYKPHITLARRVRFDGTFNEEEFIQRLPRLQQRIEKISLMKSENIKGRLTYTEVYHALLKR